MMLASRNRLQVALKILFFALKVFKLALNFTKIALIFCQVLESLYTSQPLYNIIAGIPK